MQAPEQIARQLRARGMKVTSQRVAICAWLQGNTSHPTAEEMFQALKPSHPTLSLSTVYATVEALETIGALRSLRLGGERRFDPLTDRHHHCVCRGCGAVADVAAQALRLTSPRRLRGFRVEDHHVVLSGLCAACHSDGGRTRQSLSVPSPERRTRRPQS